jgi:phage gp45-like
MIDRVLENQRQDLRILYRSRITRVTKSILCQDRQLDRIELLFN